MKPFNLSPFFDTQNGETYRSLVELLQMRARLDGDRLAYVFLENGEHEINPTTFAQLDRRARIIAAALQAHTQPNDRVLLLYPSSVEFLAALFGCFYAGVVAVPSYPPNPLQALRAMPRLMALADDARPTVLLTTGSVLAYAQEVFTTVDSLRAAHCINTDLLDPEIAKAWREPSVTAQSLAFIQYSSGSTSSPKGIMLSHGNLIENGELLRVAFEHDRDSTQVSWLPLYHDMGLIACALQSVHVGSTCYLMAPTAFIQKPFRWLKAIQKYKAHTSGAPNFAFDLCLRRVTPAQRESLDLSAWKVAFNGAEPIRASTLSSFASAFAVSGFHPTSFFPCYGLAESTVFVASAEVEKPYVVTRFDPEALHEGRVQPSDTGRSLVSCGILRPGANIQIVDPVSLHPCKSNAVGEIWVSGASIGNGYLNRPEQSESTFRACLADGTGPFLRTGDLGFLYEEQLYIAGRLKDLIIIDGRNHYPQDIEQTVELCHPAMRPGGTGTFSVEINGTEQVVVVSEVDLRPVWLKQIGAEASLEGDPDPLKTISTLIRKTITADHDISLHDLILLYPGGLPKTTSGKVQRHACKQLWIANALKRHEGPLVGVLS